MGINLPFITVDATGPKHLDMTLTRAKFDELTHDLVEATMGPVRQALADSGLAPSDLNKILLVGGSTRIPAVLQEFQLFRKQLKNTWAKNHSKASTLTNVLLWVLLSRVAFSAAT